MTTKETILLENKVWVKEKLSLDKEYFNRLLSLHQPDILWIGSIDNLVPIRDITNTEPGQVLAYRNMGGLIYESDKSLMAVLEDALDAGVKNIVVCGYSHCSSLRDVLKQSGKTLTREWLAGLDEIYKSHQADFQGLSYDEQEQKLCKMNVKQQIENLSKLPIIRNHWKAGDYPKLYGWYFDLHTGLLSDVSSLEHNQLNA